MMHLPNGRFWFPQDADHTRFAEVGDIVPWNFRPWRLMARLLDAPEDGTTRCLLRPVDVDPELECSDEDVEARVHISLRPLHEHYGLCVHCGELMPCRGREAAFDSGVEMQRMARFETPGVCPACTQPVTDRMKSETFPNIVVPLGEPVTFHAGRQLCAREMEKYRRKVAAAGGTLHDAEQL